MTRQTGIREQSVGSGGGYQNDPYTEEARLAGADRAGTYGDLKERVLY